LPTHLNPARIPTAQNPSVKVIPLISVRKRPYAIPPMPVSRNFQNFSKVHLLPQRSSQSTARYDFGPFSLDEKERQLVRNNDLIKLKAKELDVLLVLIKNCSSLVTKESVAR